MNIYLLELFASVKWYLLFSYLRCELWKDVLAYLSASLTKKPKTLKNK